ncbi:adenylyltransferase/sulfurtransferase [Dyadobacter jejuensis]|uniref:Molybdopterin-synthase adenylyltransferase n=1 Tax=Dyadobacter jejuensis TaxID=1082580 RepID=A0A316B7X8_9BACT|nr:HesA/MoeB/ThiF family protein [Dyadobacter jejuensis]PWJ58707.1 adenylyltransferase/sulfurtransferase [Dyadobacter jejuensis]
MNFEPQERKRYSRQIVMPELGLSGQEKLKNARVLVVGAGGLGCPVLQYLTAAGVGHIGIVDDDRVALTNLHRQILYGPEDVGLGKAITAKEKLEKQNPYVTFEVFEERITQKNAYYILPGYDLVVDGSDNFPTRYTLSDASYKVGIPMVFGSILRFEGQVSVFNYQGGPTYRCLFPDASEGDSCAEAGVLGILPGIIGSLMANEVVKIICEMGEVLSGQLLIYNALNNSTHTFQFKKDPAQLQPMESQAKTGQLAEVSEPKEAYSQPILASQDAQESHRFETQIPFHTYEERLASNAEQLYLVDVREEYEFEEDPINGINIPLPDLPQSLTTMPADKTIVFYCRSGRRSQMAQKLLQQNGYQGESYWMKEE